MPLWSDQKDGRIFSSSMIPDPQQPLQTADHAKDLFLIMNNATQEKKSTDAFVCRH